MTVRPTLIPKPRVVAFIDILGSSEILMNGDDQTINMLVQGLDGLYSMIHDLYPLERMKMFSDNILLYSEGTTKEDIESIISVVSRLQFSMLQDYGMLMRGGITIGILNHIPVDSDDFIIGKALVESHIMESKFAIYPRVIISNIVFKEYAETDIPLVKQDWDAPFVDYLGTALVDGFADPDEITRLRDSLVKHICRNNKRERCDSDLWDKIRSKDVWTLSYFNNFCSINDLSEYCLIYKEGYSQNMKKLIIVVEDNEMGEEDCDQRRTND